MNPLRSAVLSSLAAGCAALLAGCGETAATAGRDVARPVSGASALVASEVLPTGGACTPTGAHGKHAAFDCKTCHLCGGVLQFDPAGPAVRAGLPAPAFDAAAKTCSNVACHSVAPGTFSYFFPDGTGEPALNVVSYGGAAQVTPSWYATGIDGCAVCHGNPPRAGSSGSNVWHSGYHGAQGPSGAYNQCQFCHPDAVSTNGAGTGLSTATTCTLPDGTVGACALLHANGTVNLAPRFTSACMGCH